MHGIMTNSREPLGMTPIEKEAFSGVRAAMILAHHTAANAGWYRDPKTGQEVRRNFGEVIALMTSELSEALESDRKSLMDDKLSHRNGVEVEFADMFLRVGDTAMSRGDDVSAAIVEVARLLQRFTITEVRLALSLFFLMTQSESLGLDLAGAIIEKNRYNQQRADHKLENRAAGGKRY